LSPTPGSYALDTNLVIALMEHEPIVVARWASAETVFLPAPVLGELLYGALKSSHPSANEKRVRELADKMTFIACDEAVCMEYGRLRAALASLGRPIPENDIWVAACAVAADATLVTRDTHFEFVPDLVCEEW
jgi:tRNA(fMet)-specific endonuclease VapC